MSCELHTVLFTGQPARAQLVRLQAAWQRIIGGHDYPPAVRRMLGELVAASTLLSASLKFNGSLVLQIKGDGPVRLVVAECTSDLGVRATAMFDKSADLSDDMDFNDLVNAGGKGRFVMILDPRDRLPGQHPYQGIIGLEGGTLAQTIENYMLQSEQLQSRLWLDSSEEACTGLLLQQMPGDGGILSAASDLTKATADFDPAENWSRLLMLSDTLKPGEMLQNGPGTIARRLFWQEPNQTLAIRQPAFRCTCSRDKVARMLRSLGEEEVESALTEQGRIEVNCDYCNTAYLFDAVDCRALFIDALSQTAGLEGTHGAAGNISDPEGLPSTGIDKRNLH